MACVFLLKDLLYTVTTYFRYPAASNVYILPSRVLQPVAVSLSFCQLPARPKARFSAVGFRRYSYKNGLSPVRGGLSFPAGESDTVLPLFDDSHLEFYEKIRIIILAGGDPMNDYSFGNDLLKLRTDAGLSQAELAAQLGVTNKAVSKWEVGKAKPSTETIRKIAALFHVNVDDLLRLKEREKQPEIRKVVITGGPCAGKSTAICWVQNTFAEKGYTVLFVPETATELITAGVAPWTCGSDLAFQTCLMRLQLEKERVFEEAARTMSAEKVLIVCDRGALDNKAYMTDPEFALLLRNIGTDEIELRDGYDAVFHLVTAAKGAKEFYTTANNSARTETPEEAAELDDKLIAAWTGHPHLRVIDNATSFEDKMKRLVAEIAAFLGEPEPYEIERKYLIEYPDIKWLESQPNCRKAEIIQTYLKSENGEEIRVRQRGAGGRYMYYQTVKRTVSPLKRVEIEKRLTQEEYLRLLMTADTSKRQIRKDRYCLTYDNQYFEIDVYPFWNDRAIAEIELSDENADVRFPKQIRVIREVTDDESYKNAALAAR